MRQVDERVAQWPCGRYFCFWGGDEFLLQATDDAAAVREANNLVIELESGDVENV